MPWTDQTLLFADALYDLIGAHAFGLIDAGARDNIPEPWALLERTRPAALKVLGFEADPAEAQRLNAAYANRRTVPAAAWNSIGHRPLYITDPPQASSLFPPNEELSDLYAQTGPHLISLPHGRRLARTVDVPTTTIDAALVGQDVDADLLKIDTQGAEYEILEGAAEALRTSLFAVIAETWTMPVYKGIRMAWEVMRLMADSGYQFIAADVAAQARRSFADAKTFSFIQREQLLGQELLFFRHAPDVVKTAASPAKVYKAVAIADVYGFPDYGVELLTHILRRWPNELTNVQRCYDTINRGRSAAHGVKAVNYPALNGTRLFKIARE